MPVPHGLSQIIAAYGRPWASDHSLAHSWEEANVVSMPLPYTMYYGDQSVHSIRIHRLCAPELTAIFQEIWNTARILIKHSVGFNKTSAEYDVLTRKVLRSLGLDQFSGSFVFRPIRGTTNRFSTHAFAIALDMDAAHNPLGATHGRMPNWVVQIFEKRGWLWGGHYKGRKDWMHFQRATGY